MRKISGIRAPYLSGILLYERLAGNYDKKRNYEFAIVS